MTASLLKIPLVVSISEWLWEEDSTVTPHECLDSLPFLMSPCWRALMAKGIGIAMILAACVNKLPVIINIMNSKSAKGLSSSSIYGETVVYANCAAYGVLNDYPVTSWGENASLFIQALIIMALFWGYSKASWNERILVFIAALFYFVFVFSILSEDYYYALMTSVMPILLVSRGSQILETIRCEHTGAQSIITVAMNLTGGLIRILTTLQEMGWDFAVLSTYIMSTMINLVMFGQYFYYQKNTKVFLEKLQTDKEKHA